MSNCAVCSDEETVEVECPVYDCIDGMVPSSPDGDLTLCGECGGKGTREEQCPARCWEKFEHNHHKFFVNKPTKILEVHE